MTHVRISELVYAEPKPKTTEERQQKHDAIMAGLNVPIHLGRCLTVVHDSKTDRYAITFVPAAEKKLVLKATDEVAAFVSGLITEAGYWQGRIEGGALVDACLIQA